jgi:hypothetical protein
VRPEDEGRLRFVALPEHRWAHCHFPRAGSWSARTLAADLLGREYRQPNDQTAEQLGALKAQGWLTTWFVREPVQRFMSVYGHFHHLHKRWQTLGIVYSISPDMRAANADGQLFSSPEVFADRAIHDFPRDKHIAPQTGWGAEQCELIAPLHRANEVPLPVIFPRINATCGDYALEAPHVVRSFYQDDITYWERVCADFHPEDFQARRPNVDGRA